MREDYMTHHTGPTKVISRWDRFKRLTVWHPLNTDPDDDYRHGPRFWYPGYDIIAIVLGIVAIVLGSPLLNKLFPGPFTDIMGALLVVAATGTLLGVVFPKLYLVELVGKLVIVFMLGGYAGTVATLSRGGDPNWFVVIVLMMAVWLLGPRVTWLFIRASRAHVERTKKEGE